VSFASALPVILKFEGGYVNDPADHGGATSHGVTQATYDRWLALQVPPEVARPVAGITMDEIESVYRRLYWDAVQGDAIALDSAKLAICVFDSAVQHGVGVASRLLQRTVSATPDGIIGPQTLTCLGTMLATTPEPVVLEAYMKRRALLYLNILMNNPTQAKFKKGWVRRMASLCEQIGIEPVWEE
jgi:lysozyme family protein